MLSILLVIGFLFISSFAAVGIYNKVVKKSSEEAAESEESIVGNFILEIDNDLSDFEIEPDGYINITGWAAVFDDSDEKDSESSSFGTN